MIITRVSRACFENVVVKSFGPPKVFWWKCHENAEVCLDGENADTIADWIQHALRYQAAVIAECGDTKPEGRTAP